MWVGMARCALPVAQRRGDGLRPFRGQFSRFPNPASTSLGGDIAAMSLPLKAVSRARFGQGLPAIDRECNRSEDGVFN
jgi:hypothetical protein